MRPTAVAPQLQGIAWVDNGEWRRRHRDSCELRNLATKRTALASVLELNEYRILQVRNGMRSVDRRDVRHDRIRAQNICNLHHFGPQSFWKRFTAEF